MSGLATINEPDAGIQFTANGSGSQLNLSALTSFTGQNGYSSFVVTGSGTVQAGNLTAFSGVAITLDGTGTIATSQWSSMTNGSLTVTGGSYSLTGLTDVNDSSLYAESGGSLTLSNLTSYAAGSNSTTFEATGTGSTLNVSALTSVGSSTGQWQIEALAGAALNMSGLTTINQPDLNVRITANGSGSQLNLSA